MSGFRVIAMSTEVAEAVRSTQQAPRYGHPTYTALATGHGPCRHCLRTFQVGQEQRTLFTFDPFDGSEEVPLPGPVFIHAAECPRYPEEGGYPEELRKHPAVLVAYAKGQEVVAQVHAAAGTQECALQRLLERPEVRYIHVRDREAGCYDFRVERRNGCVATEADRGNHKC